MERESEDYEDLIFLNERRTQGEWWVTMDQVEEELEAISGKLAKRKLLKDHITTYFLITKHVCIVNYTNFSALRQ